ncbi:MAG: hypothetical protein PT118_18120 [Aphanizomenon gracile PMC644.10]|nr:hypothetical protein [Aphanizomenon gracile PMC644.10]
MTKNIMLSQPGSESSPDLVANRDICKNLQYGLETLAVSRFQPIRTILPVLQSSN